jgi:hypothetical protein
MMNSYENRLLPINIQLFAEGGEGADNSGGTGGTPPSQQSQQQPNQNKPQDNKGSDKLYTQADVDNMLKGWFDEWGKKQSTQIDEAQKLAQLDEKGKAEYQRDKLQKELDQLKAERELNRITTTARNILKEKNVPASDELLSVLVVPDAEKTKQALEVYVKAFNDAVEATVKERLKGTPPKAGSKSSGTAMTVEKIMAIKDPVERQQAIIDNKELFNI